MGNLISLWWIFQLSSVPCHIRPLRKDINVSPISLDVFASLSRLCTVLVALTHSLRSRLDGFSLSTAHDAFFSASEAVVLHGNLYTKNLSRDFFSSVFNSCESSMSGKEPFSSRGPSFSCACYRSLRFSSTSQTLIPLTFLTDNAPGQ